GSGVSGAKQRADHRGDAAASRRQRSLHHPRCRRRQRDQRSAGEDRRMSVFDSTEPRFFRPSDTDRVRRNYRSIQVGRLLSVLRTIVVLLAAAVAATMLYRRTQSDARFSIRHVEVAGAQHTTRADLEALKTRYAGRNLFHIDIARLRREV